MANLSIKKGSYTNKANLKDGDIGFAKYNSNTGTFIINDNGTLVNLMPAPGVANKPLVGQGDNSTPIYKTLPIAGGGTGAESFVTNRLLFYSSTDKKLISSNNFVSGSQLAINSTAMPTDSTFNFYVNGPSKFNGVVHLQNSTDVDLVNEDAALIIGNKGAEHMEIDSNEIMVKTNATTAGTLYLQNEGGTVSINGVTKITDATDITSDIPGALQVTGGAYIAKQLRVGTNLTVTDNTNLGNASTDTTTVQGSFIKTNGHIYLDGATTMSTTNTTQIVFRQGTVEHIALSSNDDCFVINSSTSDSSKQIALYLGTRSTSTSTIPSALSAAAFTTSGTLYVGSTSKFCNIITLHNSKDVTKQKITTGAGAMYISPVATLYLDSGTGSSIIFRPQGTEQACFNTSGKLELISGGKAAATITGPDTAGTFYFPNTGGTIVTHATRGTAVGSSYVPVYIASTGRATSCSNPSMLVNLGSTTADNVFKASPRPGVTGTLGIANGGTGATTAAAARTNLGLEHFNKEAYLTWGGQNLVNSISPVDAAMSNIHSANRFAFARPAGIIIEYSTDGGTSYVDYAASNETKIKLVSGMGPTLYAGKKSSGGTVNDKLRITFIANSMGVYTRLRKILINMGIPGSVSKCQVKVEKSINSTPDAFTELGTYTLGGNTGWNSIPFPENFAFGSTPASQCAKIRLTFFCESTTGGSFYVRDIFGFGDTYWGYPSQMAKTGHLYDYDENQNAKFPAAVKATRFTAYDPGTGKVGGELYTTLDSTTTGGKATILALGNNLNNAVGNRYGVVRVYGTSSGYTDIRTGTQNSSNYTLYLPGDTGQLVYHENDKEIGSDSTPVYIASTGRATAITSVDVAHGGTGVATIPKDQAMIGNGTDPIQTKAITDNETGALSSDSTNLITERTVSYAIANLVESAPEALSTLNDLAAALGDDPNFATTILNKVGEKATIKFITWGKDDTYATIDR